MDQYLKRVDRSSLQIPDLVPLTRYIPEEVPLLDYLTMVTESEENGWAYPRVSLLKQFQNNRGLSYESLGICDVREIFIGETPTYEIENLKIWLLDQMERDEISLPCSGLPFDTHTQRVTLYDLYRISGKIPVNSPKQLVASELESDTFEGLPADEWKIVPVKIVIGNGVDWVLVISLNLGNPGEPWLFPIEVQPELVGLISGSSVLVGFDAKKKTKEIIDFLSIISDRPVTLMGFMDLL